MDLTADGEEGSKAVGFCRQVCCQIGGGCEKSQWRLQGSGLKNWSMDLPELWGGGEQVWRWRSDIVFRAMSC